MSSENKLLYGNFLEMKQKVVVIGNSFATRLNIIRSVGEIGCEVIVVAIDYYKSLNPQKPIDCYSRYVKEVVFFDRKHGKDGLVQLLLDKCTDKNQKPVIIPTSDFTAVAIDNEQIRKHFIVPYINNTISSIEYWMNKANQKAVAIQEGLNVASSLVVDGKPDILNLSDTLKFPCFTKPLASIGGGKQCIRKCSNKSELLDVLDLANKKGIDKVLIEDYLDIDEEFAVLGFSNGSEVSIPGVIKFVRECQSHKGIAMVGEVLPAADFKEIIEKFSCFIRKIGFVGLFDIDFFKCQGEFYFGELNLRIGGSGTAVFEMGVNLPAMFVKSMLGEEIKELKHEIATSSTFVNERMCIDDWLAGKLSTQNLYHIINSADIFFVKKETDPKPYDELSKEIRRNRFNYRRLAKRLIYIFK